MYSGFTPITAGVSHTTDKLTSVSKVLNKVTHQQVLFSDVELLICVHVSKMHVVPEQSFIETTLTFGVPLK